MKKSGFVVFTDPYSENPSALKLSFQDPFAFTKSKFAEP